MVHPGQAVGVRWSRGVLLSHWPDIGVVFARRNHIIILVLPRCSIWVQGSFQEKRKQLNTETTGYHGEGQSFESKPVWIKIHFLWAWSKLLKFSMPQFPISTAAMLLWRLRGRWMWQHSKFILHCLIHSLNKPRASKFAGVSNINSNKTARAGVPKASRRKDII